MTHPIAETLARGRRHRHGGCDLGLGTGSAAGNWITTATLLGQPEQLHARLERTGAEIGSQRRDVQASIFLEAYAWRLVLPLAGALVAERRVASPSLHDVALRPCEGRPGELLLEPGRFGVLRDDPAASHHDATPAQTRAALSEIFETSLISHFEPIVLALNRRSGRSTRALWRTIADRTATALLYAELAIGVGQAAGQPAHEILPGAPPLEVAPAYTNILVEGRPVPVHLRGGCCLWWRTAAATYCATCPLKHRSPAADRPCTFAEINGRHALDPMPPSDS